MIGQDNKRGQKTHLKECINTRAAEVHVFYVEGIVVWTLCESPLVLIIPYAGFPILTMTSLYALLSHWLESEKGFGS